MCVRRFPQIMSSSIILKSPGGFYVTVELKRELTERAQREKSQREHTERAQREHLREHIGEQARRQASKQARKQASTWSAFSRSHALEGLVRFSVFIF